MAKPTLSRGLMEGEQHLRNAIAHIQYLEKDRLRRIELVNQLEAVSCDGCAKTNAVVFKRIATNIHEKEKLIKQLKKVVDVLHLIREPVLYLMCPQLLELLRELEDSEC